MTPTGSVSLTSAYFLSPLRADQGGGHPGRHHRLRQRAGGVPGSRRGHTHGQPGGRVAQSPPVSHPRCQRHRSELKRAPSRRRRKQHPCFMAFDWEGKDSKRRKTFLSWKKTGLEFRTRFRGINLAGCVSVASSQ